MKEQWKKTGQDLGHFLPKELQRDRLKEHLKNPYAVALLFFALIFIRYLFFGFTYYRALDDYIQHNNSFDNPLTPWEIIQSLGALSMRPLAGLSDQFIWAPISSFMIVGLASIALLHGFSAMLFSRVFARYFPHSPLFFVLYALLPVGFEGTYWMSASTRIIPSLFFTAWAGLQFDNFCHSGNKQKLLSFILLQTLSFGFYEQCLVLSITYIALLALLNLMEKRWRGFFAIAMVIPATIYYAVTTYSSQGTSYAQRMDLVLPNTEYYWAVFFPEISSQIYTVFVTGNFTIFFRGLQRGFIMLLESYAIFYVLGLGFLCYLFAHLPYKEERKKWSLYKGFLVSILLTIAPITPFLIIGNPWFSLRGIVPSFCGMALFADCVLQLLIPNPKLHKSISTNLALSLIVLCSIASISELHDYKESYFADQQVGYTLGSLRHTHPVGTKIGVIGLEKSYLQEQNFFYHEHIHGFTESNWALTSGVVAVNGESAPSFTPFPSKTPVFFPYNYDSMQAPLFDYFYGYNHQENTLTPLTYSENNRGGYDFYTQSGILYGRIAAEERTGTLELFE